MARLNFLVVIVGALLVACVTSFEQDVAATQAVAGATNIEDVMDGGSASRDILKKKKKKNKKKKGGKGGSSSEAESAATNQNDEGVLVNQQTSANIDGDGNVVVGGTTAPIFNGVVDVGDVFVDRKLLAQSSTEGASDVTADGLAARDLLKKKKKNKKKKNKGKGGSSSASSEAFNSNGEGVLINQQGSVEIDGDGNGVAVGATDEIFNLNIDTEDIVFDGRRLRGSVSSNGKLDAEGDGSASRDLLKKKRKKKNKKKGGKGSSSEASSIADNTNLEGVMINQQVSGDITGDENVVLGGFTSDVFNANVDTGDIEFP